MRMMRFGSGRTDAQQAGQGEIRDAMDTMISSGIYCSAGLSKQLSRPLPPVLLPTPREKEVLQRIATGKSNKHIANEPGLRVPTDASTQYQT
jgi:DNA-binding NarL/FixJ family response regulator